VVEVLKLFEMENDASLYSHRIPETDTDLDSRFPMHMAT
jgi:hypothetical protein